MQSCVIIMIEYFSKIETSVSLYYKFCLTLQLKGYTNIIK